VTERTYLYGNWGDGPWGEIGRRTRREILTVEQWHRVDPELLRRLFALADAVIDAGSDYGFGGGWRSGIRQQQVFEDRHVVVNSGGCCSWDGRRWALKPGMAHTAPPGRSYHEETTRTGKALAADMVGDHRLANRICADFGLVHFANVNSEPWHYQPVEIARARRQYTGPEPLPVWPLDEPPPPTLTPRSRPMWVICKNESKGVYHVSDGVWRRTIGTNPDPIIWASVAGGWPLKDAATGKAVAGAADVTGVPASFIEGLGVVARDMPKVAP
jgi:hypothetical protein